MIVFYLLAITIGVLVAFQAGLNAELARHIHSNSWAAVISFAVGLLVLLFYTVIVTGQMLCSLVIDHYGWLGAPLSTINWQKIAALLLMVVAVFWFQKSRS